MKLTELLKTSRLAKNLTQKELADKCNVNIRTYQKWESGIQKPKSKHLFDLIKVLDIDIKDIKEGLL